MRTDDNLLPSEENTIEDPEDPEKEPGKRTRKEPGGKNQEGKNQGKEPGDSPHVSYSPKHSCHFVYRSFPLYPLPGQCV
jgi:hypothetical protein